MEEIIDATGIGFDDPVGTIPHEEFQASTRSLMPRLSADQSSPSGKYHNRRLSIFELSLSRKNWPGWRDHRDSYEEFESVHASKNAVVRGQSLDGHEEQGIQDEPYFAKKVENPPENAVESESVCCEISAQPGQSFRVTSRARRPRQRTIKIGRHHMRGCGCVCRALRGDLRREALSLLKGQDLLKVMLTAAFLVLILTIFHR